jgi:peptidoglycan hydrolase CwlO-like protein
MTAKDELQDQRINDIGQGLVRVETEINNLKEQNRVMHKKLEKLSGQVQDISTERENLETKITTTLKVLAILGTVLATVVTCSLSYLSSQIK